MLLKSSVHESRISYELLATSNPISYIRECDRYETIVQFPPSDKAKLPGLADVSAQSLCASALVIMQASKYQLYKVILAPAHIFTEKKTIPKNHGR